MRRVVLVFLGGGLGACLRAVLIDAVGATAAPFPLAVLLANLVGSFLLGAVFIVAEEARLLTAEVRSFLAVGLLGGFTTFSAFGWALATLTASQHGVPAALYLVLSVSGGVLAVLGGMAAARALVGALERTSGASLTRWRAHVGTAATHGPDLAAVELENRGE